MPGYDLFSKRNQPLPDVFVYDTLPERLRYQIFWTFERCVPNDGIRFSMLKIARDIVCEEHGVLCLNNPSSDALNDARQAILIHPEADVVLDLVECSVRVLPAIDSRRISREMVEEVVSTLNHRFRENGVGYEIDLHSMSLIRIDSTLVHAEAVKPSLALLSDPRFGTANTEMLEAWEDFRKSDFDDCLLKCGKAFESTMKIVCSLKDWTHKPDDTAQTLVRVLIANGNLPPFFVDPLMVVATLRNKFAAHGGGTTAHHVPEHFARYALNATSSAILLIAGLA